MTVDTTNTAATSLSRPPIVAVLGHVDHGKTTLLDFIRQSHITTGEAGGITQHIGAYQIDVANQTPGKSKKKKPKAKSELNKITFIDTPGHEAFAKMRERGAAVADIALLVVAADDGVMPQTKEAISHIKQANIPMIVALNKIDLPGADPEKVKQQLASSGVLVEGFGGDVVVVPLSAKTGKGVPELLEVIILVGQMHDIKGDPAAPLQGVVIETKFDKRRGILATVIVKAGTLIVGDTIFAEATRAHVRSLTDSWGKTVVEATPSMPAEVMGWDLLPQVGAVIDRVQKQAEVSVRKNDQAYSLSLPPLVSDLKLKLILKTDVAGTLEAIKEGISKDVEVITSGIGEITESDVLMAKSTGAFIIGFHLKPNSRVVKLAQVEKVRMKSYDLIYELFEEIAEATQLLKTPAAQEPELGTANIMAEFASAGEKIAGCKVTTGRIATGDNIKLLRDETLIGRAKIKSLRHGKENIPKAETGQECGLSLDKKLDFKPGDRIISYKVQQLLA